MIVEVLERNEQAYFKADVLDVEGSEVLIQYVGETESLFVDVNRIRVMPQQMTVEELAAFNPTVGERVEVEFPDNEGPDSWWDGKILNLKNGDYVVAFPDGEKVIVDKKRMRPSYGHTPARLIKKIIPVPTDKQKSLLSVDYKFHLEKIIKHVRDQCNRLLVNKKSLIHHVHAQAKLLVLRLTEDGKNVVSIASSVASLETASSLVDMLFLKVVKIAENEAQQKMLQTRLHGVNLHFGAVSSFHVNPEYLGLMIGAKGCNIKNAQAISGADYPCVLFSHGSLISLQVSRKSM